MVYNRNEKTLKALVDTQAEYIRLLNAEIDDIIDLAVIHGWSSDADRVMKGEELRNRIQEYREKLNIEEEEKE